MKADTQVLEQLVQTDPQVLAIRAKITLAREREAARFQSFAARISEAKRGQAVLRAEKRKLDRSIRLLQNQIERWEKVRSFRRAPIRRLEAGIKLRAKVLKKQLALKQLREHLREAKHEFEKQFDV